MTDIINQTIVYESQMRAIPAKTEMMVDFAEV